MGICFKKKETANSKYYKIIQATIKNLYDKNHYNPFNQTYSLISNKFSFRRTSTKVLYHDSNNNITWKYYLLQKLELFSNEYTWKSDLYNFVNKESFPNQYIFQNRIFFEEFSLLTKPKTNKKEDSYYSLSSEPILSSLDTKELKSLSSFVNQSLVENEININNSIDKYNNLNYNFKENDGDDERHLTMNISMESITSSMIDKDPKYEVKLNSYKIKKYIQIIKKHIENKHHPINIIINEFIKYFSANLAEAVEFCERNKENNKECMKKGREIVKEIQNFIEIMQVVLKLFYSKSINYKYFIDEKDEIINLLSYILFNIQKIYKYVSKIFYFMNYEKIEKLELQFQKIGELTPKDIGINPKFCLDKETDEYMKQFMNIKNNKKINNDNIKNKVSNNIINNNEGNNIDEEKIIKSNRVSRLVEFFESNNKKDEEENIIDDNNIINEKITFNNLDKEMQENISINTEKSKTKKYNKSYKNLNYFELNEEENSKTTFKLEDFRNNIESYQDKMNIKELLINNIENECFPSLPKLPSITNEQQKEPYLAAINYLKQIDAYKVPLEKLIVIALISVIITDCIDKYWGLLKNDLSTKFLNIDADELMSIYLYIIYKMKMPSLFIHLDFIKYFTTPVSKQSMIGYYFTALEGCLNFILNIKDKNSIVNKDI